ncbi:PREDICTED: MFP1 attachment factor 1-like [Ipomoea nil]|uniref:MFP1 attachment factor 1-like n=1 Tax=Ipomoea nil TaxID=35883 RepID=UPI0009015006|nr:PREDICTED: MFP1 attachment factor 1-like [Ipomoea nil]
MSESDRIEENPQLQEKREEALTNMSEVESALETAAASEAPKKPMAVEASFSIWPPTQKTRDAVINRLIETLASPSILSKRYGTISQEEASEVAKQIEEEAYNFAAASASADDDGIEILQLYSKEISKRMLDTVKSRSAAAAPEGKPSVEGEEAAVGSVPGEEVSDVKTEP